MKTLLLILSTTFVITNFAQTIVWNGSVSSDWSVAANWTPAVVPPAVSTVTISNNTAPNVCRLDMNRSVANLNVSAGSINLNSFILTVTTASNFTGGIISNGEVSSVDFTNVATITTTGNVVFRKTGGNNNAWNGGNTFGNITVINQDDNRIRMATGNPDNFIGSATFIQLSTGALEPARAGVNTFSGNISTLGTTASIVFGAGNGVVNIVGSIPQFIDGLASFTPTINRLRMSSSNGGSLTLNVPLNIGVSLQLNSGIIMNNNRAFTLTDETVTCNIGNANSYVNGNIDYNVTTNATTRSILNFPVGKGADWRPVVVQVSHSTNTSYTYRSEVFNASARALGWSVPTTVEYVSDAHYWDINRFLTSTLAPSPNADLRTTATDRPIVSLYYADNDSVTDPINLTICKNTTAAATSWIDIGGTGATNISGNVTSTSTPSLFDSFSRFTLGNVVGGTNSLPIELLFFTAEVDGRTVQLDWSTASEFNNDFFTLQRSFNGVDFEDIAILKGKGNSNSNVDYHFIDSDFTSNEFVYYRLKQTDFNGASTLSDIRIATFVSDFKEQFEVYPNPTSNYFVLKSKDIQNVNFQLFDAFGKDVTSLLRVDVLTTQSKHIDVTQLQKGVYVLVLPNGKMKVSVN